MHTSHVENSHNMHATQASTSMDVSDDGCSYTCMTIVALTITVVSAFATFLVANEMYFGTEDIKESPLLNQHIKWVQSERMFVPEKAMLIAKLNETDMCYIMPSRLSKRGLRLRPMSEPLRPSLMGHFTGSAGVEFCSGKEAFMLESQAQDRFVRSTFAMCATLIIDCPNGMAHEQCGMWQHIQIGITNTCRLTNDDELLRECKTAAKELMS